MELTHTSYVILGLLYERPGSGYDIKQTADHSTRHFWAISFGQIYPELKRLTEEGLVEVEESPTGSRQRNVYRITEPGREALAFWVADTTRSPCEIRDEMLLKVYFSDAVGRGDQRALLDATEARHRAAAAELRATGERFREKRARDLQRDLPIHPEVLRFGIELHTWLADWYARLQSELESEAPRARQASPLHAPLDEARLAPTQEARLAATKEEDR
jgi:DNA-binding PadR family transcriptional regulator